MQNQNEILKDEAQVAASISAIKGEELGNCSSVEDAMEQPSFQEVEAAKVPYVADKVRAMIFFYLLLFSSQSFFCSYLI